MFGGAMPPTQKIRNEFFDLPARGRLDKMELLEHFQYGASGKQAGAWAAGTHEVAQFFQIG